MADGLSLQMRELYFNECFVVDDGQIVGGNRELPSVELPRKKGERVTGDMELKNVDDAHSNSKYQKVKAGLKLEKSPVMFPIQKRSCIA
jgi:hypothetical protein